MLSGTPGQPCVTGRPKSFEAGATPPALSSPRADTKRMDYHRVTVKSYSWPINVTKWGPSRYRGSPAYSHHSGAFQIAFPCPSNRTSDAAERWFGSPAITVAPPRIADCPRLSSS